jgi:hypothetical protein
MREDFIGLNTYYNYVAFRFTENSCKMEVVAPNGNTYVFDGFLKTPVAEDLKPKFLFQQKQEETIATYKELKTPLITQDPPQEIKIKKNFSYDGLWYCKGSNRFVTVRDRLGTIYDVNGKDLGYDKVVIDNRGFAGLSTSFLDYCWSGNEQFVKGTKIPWPRGKDFDSFAPTK